MNTKDNQSMVVGGVNKHRDCFEKADLGVLLLASRLLGQKHRVDVGQHTALGDGHAAQDIVRVRYRG